jgi:hypothetical protein
MQVPVMCENTGVPYLFVKSGAIIQKLLCNRFPFAKDSKVMMRKCVGFLIYREPPPPKPKTKTNVDVNQAGDINQEEGAEDDVENSGSAATPIQRTEKVVELYKATFDKFAKFARHEYRVQVQSWIEGNHPMQTLYRPEEQREQLALQEAIARREDRQKKNAEFKNAQQKNAHPSDRRPVDSRRDNTRRDDQRRGYSGRDQRR